MNTKILSVLIIFIALVQSANAQPTPPGNAPGKNPGTSLLPEGPTVVGVFDGRIPCKIFAVAYGLQVVDECNKIKMRLIFYKDPVTGQPTTYSGGSTLTRHKDEQGKWAIVKGVPGDANAVVYQLDPDRPEKSMFLLKGDDNVLFFLDRNRKMLVGNEYFSFTLNRMSN